MPVPRTRVEVWLYDETIRVLALFGLAFLLGVGGLAHFVLFSEADAPTRGHLLLLVASFFISLYITVRSTSF